MKGWVSDFRSTGRGSILLTVACACAVVTVLAAEAAGVEPIDPVAGPCMTAFTIVGAILGLRCVFNRRFDRRTRHAWGWISAGFVLLVVAFVSFGLESTTSSTQAFPVLGDYLRLLSVPLVLGGVLHLPRRVASAGLSAKIVLDLAMAVTGGFTLLWYLVIGPVLTSSATQPAYVTAVAAAYPIVDLVLITGALIVTRRSAASARRPATLLAASLVLQAVGDIYLSYQRVNFGTGHYQPWQFLCWITGCYLMAMAASAQRSGAGKAARLRTGSPVPYVPYAGVGIAYVLLLVVAVDQPVYPYGGLAYGALVATALVGARSILSLRENFRLAMTDSLTGLANRTRFHDRLTRALERSAGSGVPVAVLMLDLDGFKSVNDALGHESGDVMLVAVARAIEKSLRVSDTTARLGGDEFAVVLTGVNATEAAAAARRLAEAISEPVTIAGRRLIPRVSIGVAVSGSGRDSVTDLLHRADTSMYRAKGAVLRVGTAGSRPGGGGAEFEMEGLNPVPPDRAGADRRAARRRARRGWATWSEGRPTASGMPRQPIRRAYALRFGVPVGRPVTTGAQPIGEAARRVRSDSGSRG